MILNHEGRPPREEFDAFMRKTDAFLNQNANTNPNQYRNHNGLKLEFDVYEALCFCAKGTPFENQIELVSGNKFPDIIAGKNFGIEVKSTTKNHWTSIGSSILESTRNVDVSSVYMTFGKLADPILFRSRPYDQCLSGIAVTHYPRYQINMETKVGESIFEKMGISYEEFRRLKEPACVFASYYKKQLRAGQTLWWIGTSEEDNSTEPTISMWNSLSSDRQQELVAQLFILFPSVLSKTDSTKYNNPALWLARQGIVAPNIRDIFSAGGKRTINVNQRTFSNLPAVFGRLFDNISLIKTILTTTTPPNLDPFWSDYSPNQKAISFWYQLASYYSLDHFNDDKKFVKLFFHSILQKF